MPSEVRSASAVRGRRSTCISASLPTMLGSLMRMRRRMLRFQQNQEFIACPADAACADGKNSVTWALLFQQILDALLHRVKIVDVLVAGLANGAGQRFAGHTRDGRFAGGIDIEQHENIGLIESAAEFVPKVLGAGVPMRLKEHEHAIEFAPARRFERGANLDGVMTVIIDHGDVIDDALDIKAA